MHNGRIKLKQGQKLKTYNKPILKEFGDIKQTTHGIGSANGDGGMAMMA